MAIQFSNIVAQPASSGFHSYNNVFTPPDRYHHTDYKGILLPDFLASPEEEFDNCVGIFHPQKNKTLIYVGCWHTNDKDSLLWKTISKLVEDYKPNLCLVEGFDGKNNPEICSLARGKSHEDLYGENTHIVKLCLEKGIVFIGADMPNSEYVRPLSELGFTKQDLIFFMMEQHIPFWRRDGGFDETNAVSEIEDFMNNVITDWLAISPTSYSFEQLQEWHKQHHGNPLDLTKDLQWDGNDDLSSMPCLLPEANCRQKICAHIMHLRDSYTLTTIQEALIEYDTVLIGYGASHYYWQFCALKALFGMPVKGWNWSK